MLVDPLAANLPNCLMKTINDENMSVHEIYNLEEMLLNYRKLLQQTFARINELNASDNKCLKTEVLLLFVQMLWDCMNYHFL